MSWLSNLFGGAPKPQYDIFDVTELTPQERETKLEAQVSATELPAFTRRTLTYAYTKSYAMYTDKSPRSEDGMLDQRWGLFLVATQSKPRVILAPAGYFNDDDSVGVIDENLLKPALGEGFEFQGVIGMLQGTKEVQFRMMDDKEVEYVLDNAKKPLRLREVDHEANERAEKSKGRPTPEAKKKARQKQRRSRKTRRQNRKK